MAADFDEISSEAELIKRNTHIRSSPSNEDELTLAQAAVFIDDAFRYRSIHHKIDCKSLKLYRVYYSKTFQWSLSLVIFIILCLAFVEHPSSLSWSSDPRDGYKNKRIVIPCGVTESIELACLVFFLLDLGLKTLLFGKKHFYQSKWLWGYAFFLLLSFVDWLVTVNLGCNERYRIRRLVRPFFLLQRSSLMKKTVRAIGRTLPQILSVFFLLFLHLLIFTILGMLLLTQPEDAESPGKGNTTNETIQLVHIGVTTMKDEKYFENGFGDCLMKLLVLLTTANNPDVMIPAYKNNRLYAIYFIVFTFIGLYCFMNLLLAVVYSQFQGYLKHSLQSSYFRLRTGVRAAFEVLRQRSLSSSNDFVHDDGYNSSSTVSTFVTRRLIQKIDFGRKNIDIIWDILDRNSSGQLTAKQFQELFDSISRQGRQMRPPLSHCSNRYLRGLQKVVIHPYFNYFGLVVVALNAILISVELSRHYLTGHSPSSNAPLSAVNFFFVVYYFIEQSVKLWAVGWQRYISHKENIFDGIITGLLIIVQIVDICIYGSPLETNFQKRYADSAFYATWNILKVINILIVLRLVRTISSIQSLSVITKTLVYLLRNLKPFAGVIVALYYIFAIFGIMIFENAIEPNKIANNTVNLTCGTYEQLEYWSNNFDDFAASLVVLWDAMVVNNWHIFLHAYTRYTTSWSQLFFVAWYLISVVICVNLFVALLLDVFIDRWQETQQEAKEQERPSRSLTQSFLVDRKSFRVHEMFSGALNEPSEEDVLRELVYHGFTFRSINLTPPPPRTSSSSSSNYSL